MYGTMPLWGKGGRAKVGRGAEGKTPVIWTAESRGKSAWLILKTAVPFR